MILDDFSDADLLPAFDEKGKINEKLPTQLQEFLNTFDANPEFRVTVQYFKNESYQGRPSIIGEYADELPNYEMLVKLNGARFYRYKIAYKKEGIPTIKNIDVDLTAKNWKLLSKEGDRERERERQEQIKEEMNEKNAMIAYGGIGAGQNNSQETFKENVNMFTQLASVFKGDNESKESGFGGKEMMMFMMQMQQSSQNQMMQMFAMMNKQQSDMTIAMLGNKGNETDKLFEMAERMTTIKNFVTPREEGLIEKVGNFIGKNLDTITELFAKPPAIREEDTLYKKAASDWKMKALKKKMEGDKAFAEKLINHLDARLKNPEMTDQILEGFIKYSRHEATNEEPQAVEEEITEADFAE